MNAIAHRNHPYSRQEALRLYLDNLRETNPSPDVLIVVEQLELEASSMAAEQIDVVQEQDTARMRKVARRHHQLPKPVVSVKVALQDTVNKVKGLARHQH